MTRPRLLDLFCGQGGASMGYYRAGFAVTGVDLTASRRYPFPFVKGDALAYLAAFGEDYDVIAASPPCQAYSITRHSHKVKHPDLVGPVRDLLVSLGKPFCIENVPGAPLVDPVTLCGTMFRLEAFDPASNRRLYLKRHRLFESNVGLSAPRPCQCVERRRAGMACGGSYGGGSTDRNHALNVRRGGYTPAGAVRKTLLGVDWMTDTGCNQSIPPAYTQHLGGQLMRATVAA